MITSSSPALDFGLNTMLVVYCVVDGHPAGATCEQFIKAQSDWFTSPLVLIEAKAILTKVYSVDPAAATAKLEQFSTVPITFANLDAAGVLAAFRLADIHDLNRRESDTLYFYGRDVPSYARRLNALLTVFLANDDDSLIGFKIKGVHRILARMERLGKEKFVMHDRREGIRLTIFLEFALVPPPDEPELAGFEDAVRQYDDAVVDTREPQFSRTRRVRRVAGERRANAHVGHDCPLYFQDNHAPRSRRRSTLVYPIAGRLQAFFKEGVGIQRSGVRDRTTTRPRGDKGGLHLASHGGRETLGGEGATRTTGFPPKTEPSAASGKKRLLSPCFRLARPSRGRPLSVIIGRFVAPRLPAPRPSPTLSPAPHGIIISAHSVLPGGCLMRTVSLKLPPDLRIKLERAARQRGQSKSEVVRAALEQFLNGERPVSALELAGDLVGCAEGPGDLSTNPKYMEDFGK